ncbi:MAG: RluA family pseudouridine synthase [Hyphomicrobiales bacterium]|nr:RluA family pseudouridine synthase [Hyphomicrobiales bacterium]
MNKVLNNIIHLITKKIDVGKRLDQYISINTEFSRQRIINLIEGSYVKLNNSIINSKKYRIKGEEEIEITIPKIIDLKPLPEDIPIDIVYEDKDIIVINKQANLVVHPGAGIESGTLVNAILHHSGDSLSGIGGYRRPGIVHRLDKDTSGLMIVAKNDLSHNNLSKQFSEQGRTGKLEKIYLALVWGIPKLRTHRIETQILRSMSDRTKMMVLRDPLKGRKAITEYETIETYFDKKNDPLASLLRCKLYTGRTHQIRVHLEHIGNPVICDAKYGKGFNTKMKQLSNIKDQEILSQCKRHALHSENITFMHPTNNEIMTFKSELPDDLKILKNILSGNQ